MGRPTGCSLSVAFPKVSNYTCVRNECEFGFLTSSMLYYCVILLPCWRVYLATVLKSCGRSTLSNLN